MCISVKVCQSSKKNCSIIVDSGSCCNCYSSILVDKSALKKLPHPQPFKLDWISHDGGVLVQNQLSVPIAILSYRENIRCDIVPMKIEHIILSRPLQYDHRTSHEGHTNQITFFFQGHKFILCPLTLKQVREDEI